MTTQTRPAFSLLLLLLLLLLLTISTPKARAATVSLPPSAAGLGVSVDAATGGYLVTATRPAWTFAGTVGGPMTGVAVGRGQDNLGDYQEVTFHWRAGGPLTGAIRAYRTRPVVQFALTTPSAFKGPLPDFPAFTRFPSGLNALSYKEEAMSGPTFGLAQNGTPWFLFDEVAHTVVLSAASDFLVAQMHGDGKTLLASGLDRRLAALPPGFTHRTLLAVGTGIGATIRAWGDALTGLSGKPRPADDADITVKDLGYWTDNGATYYYNYDKSKGYAGTILAVAQHDRQAGIPIRYMQLDSWWYSKTRTAPDGTTGGPKNATLPEGAWNAYGGTLDYSASPALFPKGLAAFQKQLGLPLVVHARWIDPASPYHRSYKFSGLAPVDPRWWDDRAQYLQESGVVTYEQDWLSQIYPHSPAMADTLDAGPAFTDGMARATSRRGQTLQYCMPLPRFFLQGSRYDNLTTIRVSGDRFERGKWNDFLYTSLLADAVHIRPFTDVFLSTEFDNLTLATLSSGPVGIGDALGAESRPNLLRAVRTDGVIVKPDAPLLPTDASIVADAEGRRTPLVAETDTDTGVRTAYVFAYTRPGDSPGVSFTPASFGLAGTVYVYRVSDKAAQRLSATGVYTDALTNLTWASYIVAPVGRSGIAFLGDADKIVGTGRQRIPTLRDEPGRLTVTVAFAAGEQSVTLHGYAATKPTVSATGGQAQMASYDASSGYFMVTASPAPGSRPQVIGGDPVTPVTVLFRSGP